MKQKGARMRHYLTPAVLQTVEPVLERDLLGGSIRDSYQIKISGQETGGYYDYEGSDGAAIDQTWID